MGKSNTTEEQNGKEQNGKKQNHKESSKEPDKKKNVAIGTPYDDAFRTMLAECSGLLIPIINEVFGKSIILALNGLFSVKMSTF